MTPHLILVAGSGDSIDTQQRAVRAKKLWTGKLFELRCKYAEARAESAGLRWAVLSPSLGVLLPDLATPPHGTHRPPDADHVAFVAWQRALREGLAQLLDRAPELQDVQELRIEVHATYSWARALGRALPEHRLSFPLGELNGRAAYGWYARRGVLS